MQVVKSLANPAFALLWSGQTISRLGDNFYTVALAWWVLEKTGSAAAMGLVLICSNIPDRLGRVASIDALGSFALLPVGYGLAGIAADQFGAPVVFLLGGIISSVVIALGLLHPAIRSID